MVGSLVQQYSDTKWTLNRENNISLKYMTKIVF